MAGAGAEAGAPAPRHRCCVRRRLQQATAGRQGMATPRGGADASRGRHARGMMDSSSVGRSALHLGEGGTVAVIVRAALGMVPPIPSKHRPDFLKRWRSLCSRKPWNAACRACRVHSCRRQQEGRLHAWCKQSHTHARAPTGPSSEASAVGRGEENHTKGQSCFYHRDGSNVQRLLSWTGVGPGALRRPRGERGGS